MKKKLFDSVIDSQDEAASPTKESSPITAASIAQLPSSPPLSPASRPPLSPRSPVSPRSSTVSRSSTAASRSPSLIQRCSSDSQAESLNSDILPLRQCMLHRSSSSAAGVPAGWWNAPNSDLWNEKYQMAAYLCSVGRFGKLYTCYSETTELTVKVVRKSRWSNGAGNSHDLLFDSLVETCNSLDHPKIPNKRASHYHHRIDLQEYSLLKALQHPTILQVFDLMEDPRHYYIVTEYYDPTTMSLHAHLREKGAFSESEVAQILYPMLSCIHYCHHKSVVHCNLTLDCFCLTQTTPTNYQLKLTDLANAVVLCDLTDDQQQANNLRLMEPRGVIRYMAPEVITLDKSYGYKCDIWSIGVILYVLLTNTFPLDGSSFKQVQELVLQTLKQPQWLIQKFRAEAIWQTVSDECKHLVHRLLQPLEEDRPTPEQALQHPWMQPHWNSSSCSHQPQPTRIETVSSLSMESRDYRSSDASTVATGMYEEFYKYRPSDEFTSSLLTSSTTSLPVIEELQPWGDVIICDHIENNILTKSASQELLVELQQMEAMDTFCKSHEQILKEWHSIDHQLRKNGLDLLQDSLTREDVRQAYKILFNAQLNDQDLDKVFSEFDSSESLQGLDFFVAVLNEKDMLFTHSIQEAFEVFDTNHSGLVSTAYLMDALRNLSQQPSLSASKKAVLENLLAQVEADAHDYGHEVIAIEELVAMILESSIPKAADAAHPHTPGSKECRDPIASPDLVPSPSMGSAASDQFSRRSSRRSAILDRLSLKFSAKHFIAQRPGRLSHHYELTDFVNEGGCGAVWFCTHRETGAERAVKLVRKAQHDVQYNQRILEEFLILRELDHPNIQKQYELFEDPNFFYIIMDAARGGDLCDELDEFGGFLEGPAAMLMKQLLSCINYLHSSGYVHCDLKPENILLEANKELSQIKVIDFGFAANIAKAPNQRLSKKWGTLQYTAPEVFAGDYGKKVDLWSAGVICFLLLSDEFPFVGGTREELARNARRGAFSFSSSQWNHVSELGKDFVFKLLTVDEDKRMSASEALNHPWIRCRADTLQSELKPSEFRETALALSNLMKFSCKSKLKQATYTWIASQLLVKEEKRTIAKVFKRLDKSCNGRLTRTEIRLALRNYLGLDLSDHEVDEVFRRVDVASTGTIEYSEFLIAAMSEDDFLKSGKLRRAFDVFDVTKTGYITTENLKLALAGFLTGDDKVDNILLEKVVNEVNTNKDGVISFEEFVAAMPSSTDKVQDAIALPKLETIIDALPMWEGNASKV